KADSPDFGELSKLKSWFDKREHLMQSRRNAENRPSNLELQIRGSASAIRQQLKNSMLSAVTPGTFPDYHKDEVESLREQLRNDQEAIRKSVDHFNLQMKLGEFSARLEKGHACMLCGSVHHPQILK